jgi:hypothetical protein
MLGWQLESFLVSGTHLRPITRFLLSGSCLFVDMGHTHLQQGGSVVYGFCWSSPGQSFLDRSPVELTTIFLCLRFKTPETWRAKYHIYIPQEQGGSFIPPRTGFCPHYIASGWVDPIENTTSLGSSVCFVSVLCCGNVLSMSLPCLSIMARNVIF